MIQSSGGHCRVVSSAREWLCSVRGRLKKGRREVQTVAVAGDRVRFLPVDEADDPPKGIIEEVLPRRTRISRLASRRSGGQVEQVLMANLDQVVAVQSLCDPKPQKGFVDRLMVAAERFGVEGVLVLNKFDLVGESGEDPAWKYFEDLGYTVVRTSAETGAGVEEFKQVLTNRISLLIGASGVGKSSLLNLIQPGLRLRVNEVTEKTGLGRHTTTRTELFPIEGGGFIADSPGIRGFNPWDIDPLDVGDYFPDFTSGAGKCRYRTCLHRDEPECGVKDDLARGRIPAWRYDAYLMLLRDLDERGARGPRRR